MTRTLQQEWAGHARTLAAHHASEAAQRHARFQAYNLPQLDSLILVTESDKRLGQSIAALMRHMRVQKGRRGELAAAALALLAEALECPGTAGVPPAAPGPEEIPYRPGVDT